MPRRPLVEVEASRTVSGRVQTKNILALPGPMVDFYIAMYTKDCGLRRRIHGFHPSIVALGERITTARQGSSVAGLLLHEAIECFLKNKVTKGDLSYTILKEIILDYVAEDEDKVDIIILMYQKQYSDGNFNEQSVDILQSSVESTGGCVML